MRLFLALFLMLFAVSQQSPPPSPTPRKAAHADHGKADPETNKAESNDQSTKDLTTAINQLTAAITAENQQQSRKQTGKKPPSDGWAIANTVLVTIFTGALAILAFLQWKAMHRQADIYDRQTNILDKQADIAAEQLSITRTADTVREIDKMKEGIKRNAEKKIADQRYAKQLELTRRSADAAKISADATARSVKLQEISQKQWVNLENWSARPSGHPRTLNISFEIVNPTRVPLTLHFILITLEDIETSEGMVNVLAPNNPYVVTVAHELSEGEWKNFTSGQIALGIECKIFFADCFGIHWEQDFERILFCGMKGDVSLSVVRNEMRESGVPGEPGSRQTQT